MQGAKGTQIEAVGNYDLLEKIADGSMGAVYHGRDRFTGAEVAVKVVSPQLLCNPVALKRFKQEYAAARAIDHPNIVRAIDFGIDGDRPEAMWLSGENGDNCSQGDRETSEIA